MEEQSDLYQWLKAQESEGTVDSEGAFSMDREKAWQKLGEFQLPFAGAWVAKLVQALNASPQATELKITQSRMMTEFVFSDVPDWSRAALESAVFSMEQKHSREMAHLAVAVRALAQLKIHPFSLHYGHRDLVIWNGSCFEDKVPEEGQTAKSQDDEFRLSVSHYPFGESPSLFRYESPQVKKVLLQISEALSQHCHVGPKPIKHDGRVINGLLNDRSIGQSRDRMPLGVSLLPVTEGLPELDFGYFGIAESSGSFVPRVNGSFQEPSSGAAVVTAFLENVPLKKKGSYMKASSGPLQIVWVSDGVVISRERKAFSQIVNLGMVISADGLSTDLSGFSLKESEEKTERVDRASAEVLKQFDENLSRLEIPIFPTQAIDDYYGKRGCLQGCLASLLNPLFGIGAYVYNLSMLSKLKKSTQNLNLDIKAGLEKLHEHVRTTPLSKK